MQFFKIEGLVSDENWAENNNDRRIKGENIRKICARSSAFNRKLKNKAYFFVTEALEDLITVGAICREYADLDKYASQYLSAIGLELTEVSTEEITFTTARSMLHSAYRHDYVDDCDDVFELFDLDKLDDDYGRSIEFGEKIIVETEKDEIYAQADRLISKDALLPELDRIFAGEVKSSFSGHPVHYFVRTDDRELCKKTYRLLLGALYARGRLRSRRYCFLDFRPGEGFSQTVYECLYNSISGGAVIVRYYADDDTQEDDRANCGRETIEKLCTVMKKFRNRVLTVFCLPRECTVTKSVFLENLGNTCFVEIKEEFVSGEKAERYLKRIAKENGVRTDKKLFAKLDSNKSYLAPELNAIFDAWLNEKLKTSVYPQYKDLATVDRTVLKAKPKGSDYDELMSMIGISEAKSVIADALNYFKAQKLFTDKGMKTERTSMHMVFTGNPGTAKTTVARLFAGIMRDNGILSKGTLVEVGRGDLVGKFVGWTAPIVKKKFAEAKGGVLFIDEAYSLVDDRDGMFGDEAINTIVQEMENHRDDVVVIFAGYPDKMERFLAKNPGLRSRIAFHVPFYDYGTDELCGIAKHIAKKKGLILSDSALEKLSGVFDSARRRADFGNGRYVRNAIEKAKMAQATRLLKMDFDSIKDDDVVTIVAEDIRDDPVSAVKTMPAIGFSA